jgi:GAF domain.
LNSDIGGVVGMLQNRQGSAITEIIRVVSRADTGDQILSSSLERSKEILTFDKGAMFSINLETRQAELKAQIGIFGDPLPSFLSSDHRIDVRRPPYDPVTSTPVPVFYEEVPREEAGEMMTLLTSVGIRSLAVIPLTAGSAVLGVFYAGWTSSHPFGDEEKEILTMMGQEVGNALFKVVLQDKLVAAMTRAEINHERAEQARDEANFYLDIMTHDINNVNQTALGYIVLLSEPGGESPEELLKKTGEIHHQEF